MTDLATTIRKLRAEGKRWSDIERITGVKYEKARRLADPDYAARRRAEHRAIQFAKGRVKKPRGANEGSAEEKLERVKRLRATIPPDTRDLTGKIFGDPLPGRSALDMGATQ